MSVREGHRKLGGAVRELGGKLRCHLGQVDRRQVGLPAPRLDSRQIEEVVDQQLHPVRIGEDRLEELAFRLCLGPFGEKGLGVSRDARERGLELVGDVGHEVPANRLEPPDLGLVVEHQDRAPRRQWPGADDDLPPVDPDFLSLDRLPLADTADDLACRASTEELLELRKQGVRAVAEEFAGGGVGSDDPSTGVRRHHSLHHRRDNGRRFRLLVAQPLKPVCQVVVHLSKGLHQRVDVANTGVWEPRRLARGDAARGLGDGGERAGDGTSGDPGHQRADQERDQGGEGDRELRPVHDSVDLLQICRDPDDTGPTGHRDVHQFPPDRPALALADPHGVGIGRPDFGTVAVVLDRWQWKGGVVALADDGSVGRNEGDAVAGFLPDAVDPGLGGCRLRRQPLADDERLAPERGGDLAFEVAPQGEVRGPEQDRDAHHQDQQRPRDYAAGEGHDLRPLRSVARKR